MTTGQSLAQLYKNLNTLVGPSQARELTSIIVDNVIGRLQDDGLPVTEESIEKGIAEAANDYQNSSNSGVA